MQIFEKKLYQAYILKLVFTDYFAHSSLQAQGFSTYIAITNLCIV